MNELFVSLQENILFKDSISQRRSDFIIFGGSIIENTYLSNPSKELRQLTADERVELLSEIYKYSNSYEIDPFLPLAFAYVETRFYPTVVGKDGERSLFQFMDHTARATYVELQESFIPGWFNNQKEAVKLWFAHYRKLSNRFLTRTEEDNIRFTAIAYNAGLYRNALLHYYDNDKTINEYLSDYPLKYGIKEYNMNVYKKWIEFKQKFIF
jgi:soluble lytic murein transglycosylase-like protein